MARRWRGKREHPGVVAVRNLAYIEAMAGRTIPELRSNLPALPKKRAPRTVSDHPEPTEREIQKAILDYLRAHPKVAWCHRFNRGMMQSSYQGRESYTQFNTCRGFSDLHFLLKGGRAGYCEVKRPGRKATEDQADFLQRCADAGALAFIATSVDDVAAALA